MTHISREVIPSIQEVISHIRHIQLMDHNGIPEVSIKILKLLPVVQDHRGNLISLVRDEVLRGVEIKVTGVAEVDNRCKAMFTISLCKVHSTTQI